MATASSSTKPTKAEHQELSEKYKMAAMVNCFVVILGSFGFMLVGPSLFEHAPFLYKAVAGALGIAGAAMIVCLGMCVHHVWAADDCGR